jgi:probable HAF family extracellular repeat protein
MPRFGRTAQTAQSQNSAPRREMLPPSPPASTTGAKWWEAPWTPTSTFNWSHAFIWQDNVMTDLNTLFPASSNLFPVMANKINERGQISGMAMVLSGPHAGDIHAFLATPVNESVGTSVADVAPTHPKSNLPANLNKQLLQRFVLGRLTQ